jgi:diguanylate cyclase (GGDEF)-like protein
LSDNKVMRLRFWLGLLAVFLVAAGSIVAALAVRANDDENFHHVQREEAARAARQAEAVAGLSVGQLASTVAFYRSTGELTKHEFDLIAGPLLGPGALNGTAFVQRVFRPERAAFERAHGFPIIERAFGGGAQPAGDRSVYFPVVYAAAAAEIDRPPPVGYDIGADPIRAGYMRRAGITGMPTATPVLPLLTGGDGINVYRPVYRDRAPTATPAEREAALVGFAAGAFRVDDLAKTAAAAVPPAVDVQLQEQGRTVAGTAAELDDPAAASIQVADRTWLLVIRDPNRPDVSLPLLIAVFGVMLSALLAALILIWSRNERMQELRRLAHQDSLTGLKNRRRFDEDLSTEMARCRRDGHSSALLLLDLDNFKDINDSLGHAAGDRAIEEIAGVLRARMRETDVLARLGGDEFAIVLPGANVVEAKVVAETIAGAIRDHIPQEGLPPITVSVGIAIFGETGTSLDAVRSEADAALYAAKDAGRDTVLVFNPVADAGPAPAEPSARSPHD